MGHDVVTDRLDGALSQAAAVGRCSISKVAVNGTSLSAGGLEYVHTHESAETDQTTQTGRNVVSFDECEVLTVIEILKDRVEDRFARVPERLRVGVIGEPIKRP